MRKAIGTIAVAALLMAGGMSVQATEEASSTAVAPAFVYTPYPYVAAPYPYFAPPVVYDPFGIAQMQWALAESEAIQNAMDREMEWQMAWADNQRRWMDAIHDWHRAQSEAWLRWVDPWGAALNDWADARHEALKKMHERYRARFERRHHEQLASLRSEPAEELQPKAPEESASK